MYTGPLNAVTIEQVKALTDLQLTGLLRQLLFLEASQNGLVAQTFVSLNITVTDGGEDGTITWTDGPDSTAWLPGRRCLFQVKATPLPPAKAKEELLEKPSRAKKGVKAARRQLKPKVLELVKTGGHYILFTKEALNPTGIGARIKQLREALVLAAHRKGAITFDVYDAHRIMDWANGHISAVTFIQESVGVTRPLAFQTWKQWERNVPGRDIPYCEDDTLKGYQELIRLTIKEKGAIRVIGHSGLGKTRLVLEAFRNLSRLDLDQALQSQLVYYDVGGDNFTMIYDYIVSHKEQQSGILILDNCTEDAHTKIAQVIRASGKMRLITIDFATKTAEHNYIRLDRDQQRSLVKGIIDNKLGAAVPPTDRAALAERSEGYPQMAILLAEAVSRTGTTNLAELLDEGFIERLIFGRKAHDDFDYEIIRACSVLSSFGFLDDGLEEVLEKVEQDRLKAETAFVREEILGQADGRLVSERTFFDVCRKYKRNNILEQRGTQLIVKPTPLAVTLAAEWWMHTAVDWIESMLTKLKDSPLGKRMVERLTDLDQLDKAKRLVNRLWGPDSPFGSAEVLNTRLGSLFFRDVVEVNPIATVNAIEAAFLHMSKEQILRVIEGRRNLVWALEKLVFHEECFINAAKVLLVFGVSENERWGNNATNQFVQLFQTYLPGTEASYPPRLEVADWGLEKKDDDFTKLIIKALARVFVQDHFHRAGGAELQGSGAPLKDYAPQKTGEIITYLEQASDRLLMIACSASGPAPAAIEALLDGFRTLVGFGQFTLLKKIIDALIILVPDRKEEILTQLLRIRRINNALVETAVVQLNSIIAGLNEDSLKGRLYLVITKGEPEDYVKDAGGRWTDKAEQEAVQLAQEVTAAGDDWLKYLPGIMTGPQRQAYNFGKALAGKWEDLPALMNHVVEEFGHIPSDQQNPEFIAGLSAGSANSTLTAQLVTRFINDDRLRPHAFYLVRAGETTFQYVWQLFELVERHGFSPSQFATLKYGGVLRDFSPKQMAQIATKLVTFGKVGRWTALGLLAMYTHSDQDHWNALREDIKELIAGDNMSIGNEGISGVVEGDNWSNNIQRLLADGFDKDFPLAIARQVAEFCEDEKFSFAFDSEVVAVIEELFRHYFRAVWSIIGELVLGQPLTFLHIRNLIGSRNGWPGGHVGIAFADPERWEIVLQWVQKKGVLAARRVANMMPLLGKEGNWHPFAKAIIDRFGADDQLRAELGANMNTYGTAGSRIPYFEGMLKLMEALEYHKIPAVREWAARNAAEYKKSIRRDKMEQEERGF